MSLGNVICYSHSDEPALANVALSCWLRHGLDQTFFPKVRSTTHVFQSACAAVRSKSGVGHGRVDVRLDEVENSERTCVYLVTRSVWNLDEHTIAHEHAMRVVFDKSTEQITAENLDHFDPALAGLVDVIRANYEANLQTVTGAKIRNAIRELLLSLSAQRILPRSPIFFVARVAPQPLRPTAPVLSGLSGFLADLYPDSGHFYVVPCADSPVERSMVRERTAANIIEAAGELTAKVLERVSDVNSDRAPRRDFISNLYDQRGALLQTIEHFRQLVDLEEEAVRPAINELNEALSQLEQMT